MLSKVPDAKHTVPVYTSENETFADSDLILTYCDRLLPDALKMMRVLEDPECARLHKLLNTTLGVETRRLAYAHLFAEPEAFHTLASPSAPASQRWLLRGAFPLVRERVADFVGLSGQQIKNAKVRVCTVLDEVDACLETLGALGWDAPLNVLQIELGALFGIVVLPAWLIENVFKQENANWLPQDFLTWAQTHWKRPSYRYVERLYAEKRTNVVPL